MPVNFFFSVSLSKLFAVKLPYCPELIPSSTHPYGWQGPLEGTGNKTENGRALGSKTIKSYTKDF